MGPIRQIGIFVLATLPGCAPSVDAIGVYFPGWLVSAVVGVALAYGIVIWFGRRSFGQELADSGLFFVGLVASIALGVWWMCFSGF